MSVSNAEASFPSGLGEIVQEFGLSKSESRTRAKFGFYLLLCGLPFICGSFIL